MTALMAGFALDAIPRAFAQQLRKHDPSQDFEVSFQAQQQPTFHFRQATFEPYLNGIFTLSAGANSVEATLVSIRDYTPTAKRSKVMTRKWRPTESFSLIFRSNGKLTDLTSIYEVEHGALGKFPLFLTRRDGPRGTYYYEAVFNHARGGFPPA
jgi:hypothetical protein